MKSQFFLLITAIIISLLILFRLPYNQSSDFYAKKLSHNFENEISYIAENFNLSCVEDFLNKFKNFSESLGYNFSYICWTNSPAIKNIINCNRAKPNCCYYFKPNEIVTINIHGRVLKLSPVKEWICFYYNITGKKEYLENFFCT